MSTRGKREAVGQEMTWVLFLFNENIKTKLTKCKQTGPSYTAPLLPFRFNDTGLINFLWRLSCFISE